MAVLYQSLRHPPVPGEAGLGAGWRQSASEPSLLCTAVLVPPWGLSPHPPVSFPLARREGQGPGQGHGHLRAAPPSLAICSDGPVTEHTSHSTFPVSSLSPAVGHVTVAHLCLSSDGYYSSNTSNLSRGHISEDLGRGWGRMQMLLPEEMWKNLGYPTGPHQLKSSFLLRHLERGCCPSTHQRKAEAPDWTVGLQRGQRCRASPSGSGIKV